MPVTASPCRRSGVTLIEMLVVVAIAGAIVSIVLPAFASGLDNMRLSQGADSVAAFINGGLNRVERRQQAMEIAISPGENLIWLRSADSSFVRKLELPDGVRIEGDLRRYLLLPGATAPRFGVQLANRRDRRRIVSVDPITGVPLIQNVDNP